MDSEDARTLCPLVVLGTLEDPHVARVVARIRAKGASVFVLDYLEPACVTLVADSGGVPILYLDQTRLPDRYLIWDRAKIIPGTALYIRGSAAFSGYCAHEWRALYTLLAGLNRCDVVNPLEGRMCRIKPFQQRVAGECGFLVPPTIVSTDKACLVEFHGETDGAVVMKSLSGSKISTAAEGEASPYNVMTMRVAVDELHAAREDEISCCPHFMQREITKAYELRVVVIGQVVMPFKVDSQGSAPTRVDWRKRARMGMFSQCEVSDDLRARILAFMRGMSLVTGSLDLIVDTEGRCWFLECNQDGAWAWLDDICAGAIADAFAGEWLSRMAAIASAAEHARFDRVAVAGDAAERERAS
ncbi:hypothetical protein [Stenotrophomonas rhizophila]|uniref:hypothetical protein n=1 Tax=Stenotrophomonas rhizophila TaxID=216778 RepID=UPI001E4E7A27|nr:hypothetical protein [Stenotrophomonas rhizophila]MCC7632785.1 hypothetical protein [Stenotrophomonas rhizophila]MCC7662490.1 hypothetical protein [Stenotrophomonas rhizophila]